eukprot:4446379-Pleurochrysis_carterae.AAC.1
MLGTAAQSFRVDGACGIADEHAREDQSRFARAWSPLVRGDGGGGGEGECHDDGGGGGGGGGVRARVEHGGDRDQGGGVGDEREGDGGVAQPGAVARRK